MQMDKFCLLHEKRCIMWDDEGNGFYLVRKQCSSKLHLLLASRGTRLQGVPCCAPTLKHIRPCTAACCSLAQKAHLAVLLETILLLRCSS